LERGTPGTSAAGRGGARGRDDERTGDRGGKGGARRLRPQRDEDPEDAREDPDPEDRAVVVGDEGRRPPRADDEREHGQEAATGRERQRDDERGGEEPEQDGAVHPDVLGGRERDADVVELEDPVLEPRAEHALVERRGVEGDPRRDEPRDDRAGEPQAQARQQRR